MLAARDPARARFVTAAAVAGGVLGGALLAELIIHQMSAQGSLLVVGIFLSVQAGNMVKDRSARGRLATAALLIPAVVLAILLAAVLSENRILTMAVFVVVSGVAIWIRRFGQRAASLGAVAFMGYFFALFLKPAGDELFALCVIAASSVAAQVVVRAALLLKRPRRELAVLLEQFRAASEAAVGATSQFRHPAMLRARLARIDEIGGAIWSWQQSFYTERHIAADERTLDDRVLDARVATEEACYELAGTPSSASKRARAEATRLRATFGEAMSGKENAAVTHWAQKVIASEGNVASALPVAERLVAGAVIAHGRVRLIDLTHGLDADAEARTFSVPASPTTADQVPASPVPRVARRWDQWDSTSRMAAQVMIATALAAGVGEMISASRWYWAVMTAFVIFIGATTRSGILTRAFRRITGTALGIVVGIVIVLLVGESTVAVVAVCVLGVFGMLYFGPLNYLYSALFLTIMLVSMYRLLGVLDGNVLELRLEETVAGAVVGVLCAYLIVSTNSRPLLLGKVDDYVDALDDVLGRVVAPTPTSTANLSASLHTLESRQADLDQAASGMVTAFAVSAPHQESAAMHLMYIVTRSAARLVQLDSVAVLSSSRVIASVAAARDLASEVRRALGSTRGEPGAQSGTFRTGWQQPQAIQADTLSPESQALSALDRLRWALEQIVSARANSLG